MSRRHRSLFLAGSLGVCLSPSLAAATYGGCVSQLNAYLYPPSNQPTLPLVLSDKACTLTRHDLDTSPK